MVRPRKPRCLCATAPCSLFKPNGIPARDLPRQRLTAEEFEALSLVDAQGLNQMQAAERMGISRQTLGNALGRARRKIAEAITRGHAIELPSEFEGVSP